MRHHEFVIVIWYYYRIVTIPLCYNGIAAIILFITNKIPDSWILTMLFIDRNDSDQCDVVMLGHCHPNKL